jgi:SAM-dependent methyltransferase
MHAIDLNSLFIRDFISSTFSSVMLRPGSRLLDLGCGTKPYSTFYSGVVETVTAADYAPRGPIDVCVDASRLPFAAESFDIILFTEVIEHLPDPSTVLNEIERVLRPGGMLVLTWPMSYGMHEIPNDFSRLTEFGMSYHLSRSGLNFERLHRRGDVFAVLATITTQLIRGVFSITDRHLALRPLNWLAIGVTNGIIYLAYWFIRNAERLDPESPGKRLSGLGNLALWTLGYCAVIRKPARAA